MQVTAVRNPAPFAERVLAWLAERPVVHNVISTNLAAAMAAPERFEDAVWILVEDASGIAGFAMRTPPFPLTMTPMGDAALDALLPVVAQHLSGLPGVPGVTGEAGVTERFCARWVGSTGAEARPRMSFRMYQLDAVVPPATVAPGRLRRAGKDDRDLLVDWMQCFAAEAGAIAPADHIAFVDWGLRQGRFHLWEDPAEGSLRVSMAGASTPAGGVVRIGPVYTPPGMRRRGYASAMVAALSQRALDDGAVACMLYTDTSNPTSNAIYQRIGFRPVADAVEYEFTYAGESVGGGMPVR